MLFATHWALVCSHPSAVCVRASVPVTPWETSRIAEKTRAALPDHWSPASITRVVPDLRQQVGTATSRRRNCRLRPPFKGVMRWRMKDPPNLAMRWRIAPGNLKLWDLESGSLIREFGERRWGRCCCFLSGRHGCRFPSNPRRRKPRDPFWTRPSTWSGEPPGFRVSEPLASPATHRKMKSRRPTSGDAL